MSGQQAFIISDLHLGSGRETPNAELAPLEDFEQDAEFAAFVGSIAAPGTTLYLNGDFVDFVQIEPLGPNVLASTDRLLWNQDVSLIKLEAVFRGHPIVFSALKDFLATGAALRIGVGNHDLDWAWPKVQKRTREYLGEPNDLALAFYVERDVYHGVHIEHGHMFTPENATHSGTNFIHPWPPKADKPELYLERVWGTDFMLRFYNQLEKQHPFADNVKPMLTALKHGIKLGWIGLGEVGELLSFIKARGMPWSALLSKLLSGPTPSVPLALGSIADPGWVEVLSQRAASDPTARKELEQVLQAMPGWKQAIVAEPKKVNLDIGPDETADAPIAGATMGLIRKPRQIRAAKDRLKGDGITHVVFGHTHSAINGALKGRLFNPGTWLPHMDFNAPHVKAKLDKYGGLEPSMLDDKTLFDVHRQAVRVTPDATYGSRVELIDVP